MSLRLWVLGAYSLLLIGVGVWWSRRVRSTADFFVAGRRLGPGLLGSTILAANIGAGSTVGATALGYRDGLSAWWWVGSAGIGSAVLAWGVGPAIRRAAARHDFRTVGDFLEHRFGPGVRGMVAAVLWLGTLAILAGQLLAFARILETLAAIPKPLGCLAGGAIMTAYFAAGGLLSSAAVNLLQLAILLAGFAVVLPLALWQTGGFTHLATLSPAPDYWRFAAGGGSGWMYVPMLAPAFIVSPGLIQKVYAARDDRTVRLGVGANAVALLLFAFVPTALGMVARVRHPGLAHPDLALPTLLVADLPAAVGTLGLAALMSAEISTADAILFMLATSLSRDLYHRFVRPAATDRRVLQVARGAALTGGTLGVGLAIVAESVIETLSVFYAVLTVSLAVPLIGGLYTRRPGRAAALVSIAAGVAAMAVAHAVSGGAGFGWLTPTLLGLIASAVAFAVAAVVSNHSIVPSSNHPM